MNRSGKPRLAIIGAGQLGMFLCEAARALDVESLVVTPDENGPALERADRSIIAKLDSDGLAIHIACSADIVTFEFENVPEKLLGELAVEQNLGTLEVRPGIAILRLLKNKSTQKQWLQANHFPTLPFITLERPLTARERLLEFGLPFVQKAQTGGYDGYGVQVVRREEELDKVWNVPSIIETCVHQPVELGVVVARSASGSVETFAPVRMDFRHEHNILDAVVVPSGLDQETDSAAMRLAGEVVMRLQGVGIFAIEMFLLPGRQLLVNEISPRVHNSGHHTLETCRVSQFEQHLRAVCDLPLIEPGEVSSPAVMRNLLYSDELAFLLGTPATAIPSSEGDVMLHWYGKKQGREGRKMGHFTCQCLEPEEARDRMRHHLDCLRQVPGEAAA